MSEEKLYSVKPEFILEKCLAKSFVTWLPVGIFAGLQLGMMFIRITGYPVSSYWGVVFVISLLVFAILASIDLINEKFNYKFTEYDVYQNRVEFTEGFINSQNTTLMLSDVKEIHLKRSFIQKFWDLGTIRFITAANAAATSNRSIYATGVNFRDIKNSQLIYIEMKKLADAQKKST